MSATRPASGAGSSVHSVTTAPAPRSADRDVRMRRYVIQMSVRTACFVGAVFTHGWLQIALILGAIVLPYVAVVSVNNAPPPTAGTMDRAPLDAPALTAAPEPRPQPQDVVVEGEVVDPEEGPAAPGELEAGPTAPDQDSARRGEAGTP